MFLCTECDHWFDDSELSPFMANVICNGCAGDEADYL